MNISRLRTKNADKVMSATSVASDAMDGQHTPLTTDSIAIVGLSCRFPKANNIKSFWENMLSGKDCIDQLPTDRQDSFVGSDKVNSHQLGGFLSDVFEFDHQFFNIKHNEAISMDPQQRIVLEEAYSSCHDATYDKKRLFGTRTGVFVGIGHTDMANYLEAQSTAGSKVYAATGSAHSIAANRISFALNLTGPSMAIDTACSSALIAIDTAVRHLRDKTCDQAIVAAVSLLGSVNTSESFDRMGFLSPKGRCHTFDAAADGYVRSEGAGAVFLMPKRKAIAEGLSAWAYVVGTATNQDGLTATLTAPNGISQQTVIRSAIQDAGLSADDIGYVECHGTGTPLGDPIEIGAIAATYGNRTRGDVWLGSVKANIGHTEFAAGMAGLFSLVMTLNNQRVPPLCGFREMNPLIQEKLADSTRVRIGGDLAIDTQYGAVSSFGFGGSNGHIIVQRGVRTEQREAVPYQRKLLVKPQHFLGLTDAGSMTSNAVLLDHVVNNVAVFPGAGYADAMLTFTKAACLNDIEFLQLLPVERLTSSTVSMNGSMIEFVAEDSLYCRASLSDKSDKTESNIQQNFNPNEIPFQPIDGIYQRFADIGLQYGETFQTIVGIHRESERSVLTHLRSKSKIVSTLDPTLLDGCFQSLAVLLSDSVDGTYVPHSIGRLFVAENKLSAESDDLYCRATWTNADWYHCTISADFEIYRNNRLFCNITNFVAKKVIGQSTSIASDTYVSEWIPLEFAVKDASDDTNDSESVEYAEYTNPTVDELLKTPSVGNMVIFVSNIDWQVGFCKSLSTERSVRILVIVRDKSAFTKTEIHKILRDTSTIRILRKIDDLIEELTIRNSINTYSAHRWVFAERGSLSNLRYLPLKRLSNIDPNMVEVEIEATSANFRDVLNVLGSYIDRTVSVDDFIGLDPGSIGGDIAGRVVRVGSDVSEFQPGDLVWGIGANSFGNFTTTHRSLLSKICSDSKITKPEYAAMPVVMMTTEYCMVDLGKVKKGDWVLVHSAAGGVGQCVIQYCNQIGATVVATCGSEEKRRLLQQQGVKYIFNSRDAELFASEYDEALQDKKIDVVINSLSDKFINNSASRLKPNGVFIEIGKRGIWSDDEMKKYRSNVEYHRVRLDEMIKTDPYSAGELLRRVNSRLNQATDQFRPLAITEYPMNDLVDAFRVLQRGENVGNIVLTNPTITNKISNGTVLITGGTGALGCHLARWLSTKGYDDIHLLSRSGNFPDELSDLKKNVKSFAIDCTNEFAVIGHIDKIDRIIGIVCCAGVLRDKLMPRTDAEIERYLSDYQMVWDTKVRSAETMDRVSRNFNLDFFVTYSSVVATFGNIGQTNYSAANAALDALIERRNQNGLPGLSIQWGPWNLESEQSGMNRGMVTEQVHKQLEQQGIVAIDEMTGYAALDRWFNTQGIVAIMPKRLTEQTTNIVDTTFALPPGTESEQKQWISEQIYETLKEITNVTLNITDIESTPFMELGLDSLVSIEFRQSLVSRFKGVKFTSSIFFDYPSIQLLSKYIFDLVTIENRSASPADLTIDTSQQSKIVVIGMSCRFPESNTIDEYWNNLLNKRESIRNMPVDRYIWQDYFKPDTYDKLYTAAVGAVDNIYDFDYKYFRVSKQDAIAYDPQHRLALTLIREAFEDAHETSISINGTLTDVYLGIEWNDYGSKLNNLNVELTPTQTLANTITGATGKIADFYNFKGICIPTSGACASSLMGIENAIYRLREKHTNTAFVGGVHHICDPKSHINLCNMHAISPTGKCSSFDDSANGYVRGEGGGFIMLRREKDCNDLHHYAYIEGGMVAHDGTSATLSSPNGTSQIGLVTTMLKRSKISGHQIDYVEAHGTGTPMGDPIEYNTICDAYGIERKSPLYIGTVKANIGHLETAAGIAGLIKTILILGNQQIPAQINFESLNKKCDIYDNIHITSKTIENDIKYATVHSFGMTGVITAAILSRGHKYKKRKTETIWQNMERVIHPLLVVKPKHYLGLTDVGSMTPNVVLLDHVVNNVAVFPGAGYVDAMLTFTKAACLNDIEFVQLLPVERLTSSKVSTNGSKIEFVADDSLYCRASLSDTSDNTESNKQQNFNEIPFQPIDGIYQHFADIGLQYEEMFQTIVGIHRESDRSVLTHLRSKSKIVSTLDPTLLDGCFQSLAVLLSDSVDGTYVPHSIGRLFVAENKLSAESDDWYCKAKWTNADWYRCTISADFEIYRNNCLFCKITDFVAKKVIDQSTSIASDTYVSEWIPLEFAVKDASDDTNESSQNVEYAEYTNPTVDELLKTPSVGNMVIFVNNIDWQVGFCKSLSTERSVRILVIVGDKSAFTKAEIHNLLRDTTTIRILRKIDDLSEEYTIQNSINTYSAHRWVFAERGSLSNLRYLPFKRLSNIDPNMVEVEIEATSANFRDVLNVLGSYIDRTVSTDDVIGHNPGSIGGDIAGRVVRVGSDVSEFQTGDRVWGIGANSFGNFTTTHSSLLSKICSDSKITQSEYAAMPVVMMTTEYCMVDLGKAKRGDWVLVHSAAGGVGQCVIQYCNQIGATVVATCGSEEKRQLLRQQGVRYIFNSRDAELFASEYDEALSDKKIDVVINSLSDNYINYSASRLKPNGVFIEIGKRGIWSDDEMKKYRSDVEYHRVRLDEMIKTDPYSAGDLLRRVNCRLNNTADPLRPLAITEYPMIDLVDAFRVLQRGENVGKIVLTNPTITTNKISNGTVLITGGTGALGCHLARWLSTKGYDDIHLLSRSGKFPDELSDLKLKVQSFAVDCTNELAVRRHIDKFDRIIGVVCCAGVLRDQLLPRTDAEIERYLSDYQMVWDTKVRSAETMDRVSGNFNLDFFVTYSSVAATFGNTGQTNYSAANAALDALIERRNQNGLPGLSIQWGPWSLGSEHSGMATEQIRKQLEEQGIVAIDEMTGYAALDRWFDTQGIVAIMPRANQQHSIMSNSPVSDWRKTYASHVTASMPKQERTDIVIRLVSTTFQTILSIPAIESDSTFVDSTFGELGIDSLTGIEFVQTLSRETGLKLSSTTIYEYSTIRTLGEHLFERLESELLANNATNVPNTTNTPNTPNKTISPLVATSNNQPAESTVESTVESSIGVLAYDIICPGASNKTEFWDNLTTGKTSIVHRFPKRVIGADVDNNQSFERYGGGFIDETTMDPSILKQYPTFDPQQQLGIQMTHRLLESLSPETRKRSRIGVLVGCSSNAHSQTTTNPQSSALSCIGGRIGQHFDLNGPVMTIDTACSSSLVALDSAMMVLQAKKADYVVVLGINWIHDCSVYRSFAEHHLLSSDGAVHTYGAGGTGFVRAESVAGVLLCRRNIQTDAANSANTVNTEMHEILATGVNHNGKAMSMGVPRADQLRSLFKDCLNSAQLQGCDINVVETHTVGTELGDAIELNAMMDVYSENVQITSCKPNIGHPEPAAGLVQLVKLLLMADHRKVPSTIVSTIPNPNVQTWKPYNKLFSSEPDSDNRQLPPRPLLATTSIGFSGTNAHAIVRGRR